MSSFVTPFPGQSVKDFLEEVAEAINTSGHFEGDRRVLTELTGLGRAVRLARLVEEQAVAVRLFRVTANTHDNFIETKAYDAFEDTEADEVTYIAKPHLFRKDLLDGTTIAGEVVTWGVIDTRSRDGNQTGFKTEDVYPAYALGDWIVAAEIEGGTNLTDPNDEQVTWMDLNVDARYWLVREDQTSPPIISRDGTTGANEGNEATNSATWDVSDQDTGKGGVQVMNYVGTVYDEGSNQVIYGYYRLMNFSVTGRLMSIDAEGRYGIETPVACP